MLHVIRRNIPLNYTVTQKRKMYLALVKSHLCYGFQLWRPHLLKDVRQLERVQRYATKFILQDFLPTTKLIEIDLPISSPDFHVARIAGFTFLY